MRWLRNVVICTVLGGLAGTAVGAIFESNVALAVIRGTAAPRALFPALFIPVWIGVVVGFTSKLRPDSGSGIFLCVAAGLIAGLAGMPLYQNIFGAPFIKSSALISAKAYPMLFAFFGGIAAAVWSFTVAKLIR